MYSSFHISFESNFKDFPPFTSSSFLSQEVSATKYFDEQMLLEIARQEALMEAEEEH